MKVSFELSPEYRIPYAVIYVDKITDEIQKIMDLARGEGAEMTS